MSKIGSSKNLKRAGLGLAAGILVAGGLGTATSFATGADESPKHRANAELMDSRCAVPPEHDLNITKTVHQVASDREVNEKVMLAAFEAGWVESHMNNLDCGDKDSLGVFQQRPSQGWGTPEQIMDPVYATNAFLDQAIPNDANNPDMTPGELADSVQRSAFPERYDEAEGKAKELIAEVQG